MEKQNAECRRLRAHAFGEKRLKEERRVLAARAARCEGPEEKHATHQRELQKPEEEVARQSAVVDKRDKETKKEMNKRLQERN